jgi:membrane-associated phospholipid phosphatase
MRPNFILSVLILFAPVGPARAQDRSFPYTLSKRDLVTVPIGIGLSVWGGLEAAKHRTPLTREEIALFGPGDVNGFDRSATRNWSLDWDDRSDTCRDAAILAAIGVGAGEVVHSRNLDEVATLGVMFLETSLLVGGTTYLTKALVGRKRPFVYNTALSVEERYRLAGDAHNDVYFSFFSGHSSAAFALATFTSTVYSDIHGPSTWSTLLWGSTLTLATLTAYARVKAGVHYPTDVIAGAIVGGAIGRLVPVLHRRNASQRLTLGVMPDRVCLRLQLGAR